jgi:hypothetical protein
MNMEAQAIELHKQDKEFAALGATHHHDALYPFRRVYCPSLGHRMESQGLFARHYFNAQGTEIGYILPDLLQFGSGVHYFEIPREWTIPHDLIATPGVNNE